MPDMNDGARPQKESSKDFVEHLRLVHFTLIVTCLALLVIVFSPPPKLIERAREQLRQITNLANEDIWGNLLIAVKMHSAAQSGLHWDVVSPREFRCPSRALDTVNMDLAGQHIVGGI